MDDDNKEGFEDKKRNSSVFELKRHYEKEIESLKRDLITMQREELKLKTYLDNKNTLSKEFTFKSEKDNTFLKHIA